MSRALSTTTGKVTGVQSISYTKSPLEVETALIRVTVEEVKCMPYDMLIQMEGGKEALDKYGPVFSRDKKPKA